MRRPIDLVATLSGLLTGVSPGGSRRGSFAASMAGSRRRLSMAAAAYETPPPVDVPIAKEVEPIGDEAGLLIFDRRRLAASAPCLSDARHDEQASRRIYSAQREHVERQASARRRTKVPASICGFGLDIRRRGGRRAPASSPSIFESRKRRADVNCLLIFMEL